ncbi:MAG: hypothetical protein AB9903_18605 [Vulcanimicrobiota bacterium]
MSIQATTMSLPLLSLIAGEKPKSPEKHDAAPILEEDRYLQRPDYESWVVNGKEFKSTKDLLAAAADMKESQPATFKYKSGTLKDNLLMIAAGTAIGIGVGAVLTGLATIAFSAIGSMANVVLWPANFNTDFFIIANAITGAGAGAAVFGGGAIIGAGVNQFYPVKINGTLTKENTPEGEALLFKPSVAEKKAIDIKAYDKVSSTHPNTEKDSKTAWWDEAAQVQRDARAGYATDISF